MNDHAKQILEGYQPGDHVQVTYGTRENQQNISGTILEINDYFLKLSDQDATISVEDLRSIAKKTDQQPVPFDIQRRMVSIPPAASYQFSFGDARIKDLRNEIKSSCSKDVRNITNRVLEIVQGAVKNNALKDKYPGAKKLIMDMWGQCVSDADYRYFYLVLGTIAVVAEKYDDALEPLVRAKDYQMAAYAAAKGGRKEWQERLYMCSVLARKDICPIDRYFLDISLKHKDIEPLCFMLRENRSNNEACELIASCLAEIYRAARTAEFQLVTVSLYDGAAEAADKIQNAFPSSWRSGSEIMAYWQEYEGYAYPKDRKTQTDKEYYGTISKFISKSRRGYINNYGFSVSQVIDDDERGILLRRLLSCGQACGLEVSFFLGEDQNGYCAATDIMLTDKGFDEANHRLQPLNSWHGEIKKFFPDKGPMGQGYIKMDGHPDYSFYGQAIIDPYLKAFISKVNNPAGQFVGFSVGYDAHGKKYAYDLFWEDPKPSGWDQYAVSVPTEELDAWEKRTTSGKTAPDDANDYSEYKFYSLPPWQPDPPAKPNPLTWPAIGLSGPVRPASVPGHDPKPQVQHDAENAKILADRGRSDSFSGRLNDAERHLSQALELGAPPDSVVGELITVYLRMPEKLEAKAVPLLEKYAGRIQANKLMNLRISVYDKLKDYAKLASLYEEAYQKADTVSKRAHILYRLIDAYLACGDYDKALEACKRWDTLYQQNRYGSDAGKLKKDEPNINRKKAISLYHRGDVEEARHIAIDLLRLNPDDEAANAILDGTLTENIAQLATPEDEAPYEQNVLVVGEDDGAAPSSMPGFVAAQIMAIDVGSILKGSVKDGKYSGDVKKAERDIKELAKSAGELRGGNTAKTRSDRYFAACRIIEDVEARASTTWSKDVEKEERLAGRAMALWGDYMVGWSAQMDTPRMAYLYALRLLSKKNERVEQHWANAYTRYIKSYFISKKDLGTYIDEQASSSNQDGPNTDILVQGKLPDVLFAEFFVGVLKLLDALSDQKNKRDQFIRELYEQNRNTQEAVCRHMRRFLNDDTVPSGPDQDDFGRYLDRACEKLHERMDGLKQKLESICRTFLEAELSSAVLEQLDKSNWALDLIATDATRMVKIYTLLQRSQDYFTNTDFESRAECLRTVLEDVNTLQRSIQSEPTELSYDVYLPALQTFAAKLSEKQDRLYADFKPLISWDERPSASRTKEGTVQVQLKVRNESSHQAADQLHVADNELGDAVKWVKSRPVINSLHGGEEKDFILELDVTDTALADGSFSLRLCYAYKYNGTPQTVTPGSGETLLSVVLPNAGPIKYDDPYKGHIGNPMTDEKMFYGRDDMIEQLVRMVYSPEEDRMTPGHATAIYGQTRCGKSSIFYHLKTRLKKEYGDRVVIWDVGNIGDLDTHTGIFLSKFIRRLLVRGKSELRRNAAVYKRIQGEQLQYPENEIKQHPEEADVLFTEYMTELNGILEEDCVIVLLIDEFTYLYDDIKKGTVTPDFMKFWKSLLESYRLVTFVIGQDNMKEFKREFPNEFESMHVIEISYLDETSAKRLIREPLERACGREGEVFDREAVDMLYKLTAGSAYLTMILCSNLVGYLNDRQSAKVTTGIVEDFLNNWMFKATEPKLSESNFEPQMHERGHQEFDAEYKEILASVALNSQTNGWASEDAIRRDVNAPDVELLLQRLTDRRILLKTGNQYKIHVGLLERWLIYTEGGK